MKKKQANLYSLPPVLKNAPYLSAQQLSQFQSEFTLFDSELDLRKLKQSSTNINNNSLGSNQNYKPVDLFISIACGKKQRCSFDEYLTFMTEHFRRQDEAELIMDMLSDNKKDIKPNVIKEILEEAMGREVTEKQLGDILLKIFEIEDKKQPISKRQIINLLSYSNSRT